jgi:hypothetical protein
MTHADRTGSELIRALSDWERAGAVWRLIDLKPAQATVALLRCDAGEEVDRISSGDPVWLEYLRRRPSSEQ